MGENEEQEKSVVQEGVDKAKNWGKAKIKSKLYKLIAPIIPYILIGVGIFFAALLLVGLILAIQMVVQDTITSIISGRIRFR